ncbi:hypothetical protein F5B22DRAFT_610643 [Xylaria bambusicola]|uniref:uncharacterized protein n=1 Tax=Xylaria bambusicola TaxID=326684 RepID=UPI0020084A67|nr:uncharacterized protein F5B22DRAFT_610643 [Xylaria bambusicola]KAI0514483.1 hypothetical protein F5B22DRAFT_610643 [Xylaria bambusicola]
MAVVDQSSSDCQEAPISKPKSKSKRRRTMAANGGKLRAPRMRQSCDGCFLAKVKCSKGRPMCTRCLACGIACHYSPSSRSTKQKAEHNPSTDSNLLHGRQGREHMGFALEGPSPHVNLHPHPLQTNCGTPSPYSIDDSMNTNPFLGSNFHLLGIDEGTMGTQGPMSAPPDVFSGIPWHQSADMATYSNMPFPATHIPSPHARSQSFDAAMSSIPPPMQIPIPMTGPAAIQTPAQMTMSTLWGNQISHEPAPYSQVQTPNSLGSNYFPSPTMTPILQPIQPCQQNDASCTCLIRCLQGVSNIYNLLSQSKSADFDSFLRSYQHALDECNKMIKSSNCADQREAETRAMLYAVAVRVIADIHARTRRSCAEGETAQIMEDPQGIDNTRLGTFQLEGNGKWTKMNAVHQAGQKLEGLFTDFRHTVQAAFANNPELAKAMINYTTRMDIGSTVGTFDMPDMNVNFAIT